MGEITGAAGRQFIVLTALAGLVVALAACTASSGSNHSEAPLIAVGKESPSSAPSVQRPAELSLGLEPADVVLQGAAGDATSPDRQKGTGATIPAGEYTLRTACRGPEALTIDLTGAQDTNELLAVPCTELPVATPLSVQADGGLLGFNARVDVPVDYVWAVTVGD
ncbi:hypothetical protein ACX80W_14025 [Arthrobacter sp. TMN-37]